MKKKMIAGMLAVLFTLTASAGSVDQLFNKYKSHPKAEYVHIPKLLMKMGLAFSKGDMDKDCQRIASKISSVRVLELDDCNRQERTCIAKEVDALRLDGYESLIKVNNDNEKVNVLLRQKGKYIEEMLVINCDEKDFQLVQLKGKIRQEDIEQLINSDFAD